MEKREAATSDPIHHRTADHPIHPLILSRWSSRALSGEPISESELKSLFEAARWAPSSYNGQPWRFIYAKRDTPVFPRFVDLLIDFNKQWASKAAVLGVIAAHKVFEQNKKPSITHGLDTGAAWENICLEGASRGLVVHGMEGFDYQKARTALDIPDEYEVLAMFAIGKKGPTESLSADLQKREAATPRKRIEEFAMEGKFRK